MDFLSGITLVIKRADLTFASRVSASGHLLCLETYYALLAKLWSRCERIADAAVQPPLQLALQHGQAATRMLVGGRQPP